MPDERSQLGMTGGDAIVAALDANGVRTVFGLPGAQIYPLFDAIARRGLTLYVPRHEQAAGYMAMGYAKSTGRPAVCCVVPGPGVLNASAALCTAMGNCSPVICITGQVPSEYLGRGRGHLHELADQLATLRGLIKRADRIERPSDAPRAVNDAISAALAGRPGPTAIEMCWDRMAEVDSVELAPPVSFLTAPEPDSDALAAAADMIARARKPLLMC